MDQDSFRFLDPWTQLLPRRGAVVVAFAGSGGCTTALLRFLHHLRSGAPEPDGRRPRVLVTQTAPHPVPMAFRHAKVAASETAAAGEMLEREGVAWVVGEEAGDGTDRHGDLAPARIEGLRSALAPDVVLVQAQASAGTPLRRDGVAPRWPESLGLAVLVAPVSAVGRLYGPQTVRGAESGGPEEPTSAPPAGTDPPEADEPRRIRTEDVVDQVADLVATVPEGARPLPFFTGFGSYRDMDGMFEAVQRLWDPPRVPLVCLAELLGDPRRDEADRRGLQGDAASVALEGERVYALYPASLDES